MRKLPVIVAAACTLSIAPALAETDSQQQSPPGSYGGMRGKSYSQQQSPPGSYGGMRGKSYGEAEVHRHGERGWRGMQEGCKYITVRQR
ncbi:MAG: hypothetical protein J2P53_10745, partial [Bradyrhizobiaceae bacterium]|nr:hypothetical protein [Bradyrhizobiaceae bacterium]